MVERTFFLGANSCSGFHSLYEDYLRTSAPERVWILKGGAGCGKSGFLRRVAQRASEAGFTVHRILCSGDPASLDGIHIEELHTLMFDGTAPHVLEPPLVGNIGFYQDLSRFYQPGVPALDALDEAYREHYRRAYRWLAAAGSLQASLTLSEDIQDTLRRKAVSLISRELRKQSRNGRIIGRYFTDAFTGEGLISLSETRKAMAPRLISLQGICGAENCFLATAANAAAARGWDTVICPDPLQPERIAHLLIPEHGFGLSVGEGERRIHLDRLIYSAVGKEESARIRETEAMRLALLSKARKELQAAKFHHDRLEAAVNPYVDFSGVYTLAEDFAQKLLSGAAYARD